MLGLHFDNCNQIGLSFSFDGCQLKHSSFYKLKIKKTVFRNTQLQEADFSECDLTAAQFDNCDLSGVIFNRSILEKADFRTASNYTMDPEINKMKGAKFSVDGVAGLLRKYGLVIE
jgi:uncharacterized protein YjbI with pentapeptide repeats